MGSPLFGDDEEEDWAEFGLGAYDAVTVEPPVHDAKRMQRRLQAKRDGERLWEEVQRELRRTHDR